MLKKSGLVVVGVFVAGLVAMSSGDAHAEKVVVQGFEKSKRDTWYIGFGLGSGDGTLNFDGGNSSKLSDLNGGDNTKVGINFKVGATLSPKLLLGFDMSAVGSRATSGDASIQIQENSYMLAATFFPMETGLFLRGGAGLAAAVLAVELFGETVEDTVSGVGAMVGGGYAFWVGDSFNLTLNADYHMHKYDGEGAQPQSGSFYNFYLGFEWH